MSKVIHISDSEFQKEVMESKTLALVVFWAEWCGPCKLMAPVIDNVSNDFSGKLRVFKMNIDENQLTPPKYGIRGIPSMFLVRDGVIEEKKIGSLNQSHLYSLITCLL